MNLRNLIITALTIILVGALLTGLGSLANMGVVAEPKPEMARAGLANVRAYAPATDVQGVTYAVDSGLLFEQSGPQWLLVETPEDVIVNDVVAAAQTPDTLYIGAANELAVYRSTDAGVTWLRVPLSSDDIGGVTSLALDETQRILYAGTDTAGIFRLRDVGSSMILSGNLPLPEPVIEVVANSNGQGLAFARTAYDLYRADNFGLEWTKVDNLGSSPTALAVTESTPATLYVGTADRGVVKSHDGRSWTLANAGLGLVPGSRLHIDALTIDPQQPEVIYAATSYLFGSTTLHQTPVSVAMSIDGAAAWAPIEPLESVAVAELLPVPGQTGAVYALMENSRAPLALGGAPEIATTELAIRPLIDDTSPGTAPLASGWIAWVIAGLAAVGLIIMLISDIGKRQAMLRPIHAPRLIER